MRALCHATTGGGGRRRRQVEAGRPLTLHFAVERAVKQGASTSIVRALVRAARRLSCPAQSIPAGGGRAGDQSVGELEAQGAASTSKLIVVQEAARARRRGGSLRRPARLLASPRGRRARRP